jgi:tRNA threonylcarbamoyladenosine biosynthesis protein TsaE
VKNIRGVEGNEGVGEAVKAIEGDKEPCRGDDSMGTKRFMTRSEAETRAVARELATRLSAGATLLLSGDLGAGKTAFVKGLAEGLGIDPADVTSPTFTLVHEYRGGRLPLIHVDLYRLGRADLDEVGLDSDLALAGVVAIEWAERLMRTVPGAVHIQIADAGGNERVITYSER